MLFRILTAAALLATAACGAAAEHMITAPAPAVDAALVKAPLQKAVFAGGCFWGVEGVFERVKGVTAVRSGYAGGNAATALYQIVGSGLTGHAEAVEISYDPARVSYGTLLRILFSVAHDPTQLNRQGPDSGSQYRSAIFPQNADQARLAKAYIAQLAIANVWGGKIVTSIEPGKPFYPAENYHQNFLRLNPTYPYIVYNDLPKVEALKARFPQLWSDKAAG